MNKTLLGALAPVLAAAAMTSVPTAARADLSFNVGGVSEYRYRGITQTRFKPALQGGADYTAGGFYVGTWASTIKWIKDAGGKADAEIDIYAGFKGDIVKDSLTFDVGVLTYQYPRHRLAISPVTTEVYGAVSFGPASLKYSHSITNLFGFADSKNSGYVDLSASFDVGNGIVVAPHIGYQKVAHNGDYSYTDASVGVSKDFNGLVPSLTLVGTNTKHVGGNHAYSGPTGKNHGRTGVVLGLKYTF